MEFEFDPAHRASVRALAVNELLIFSLPAAS
jgi:hypothetical protein